MLSPEGQVLASDTVVVTVIDFGLASVDLEATDAARKHDITRDTGGVYDDVEWVDPSPDGTLQGAPDDHRLPVCYTRSGPHGDVHVRVEQVDIRLLGNLGATSVMVRADGTIGGQAITLPETAATSSGDQIVAMNLDSPEAIPDVIRHTEIILNWQVSLDGGPWLDAGTSVNTAYITWDDPLAAAPFETCLYVGSQAADGIAGSVGAGQPTVLNAIWSHFATREVRRADGKLLTYYGFRDNDEDGVYDPTVDDNFNDPTRCDVTSTARLLANRNGQCHAWAEFLRDVLSAQGIDTIAGEMVQMVGLRIKTDPPFSYDAFAVKNWATSGTTYPKMIIDDDAGVDGSSPSVPNPSENEAADAPGAAGQGTSPNPPSMFFNHFIVKAGGRYYDPSYGLGPFEDRKAYEDAAFAGGIRVDPPGLPLGLYLFALPTDDHDPNTTSDLICVYTA